MIFYCIRKKSFSVLILFIFVLVFSDLDFLNDIYVNQGEKIKYQL
jgi:hypothetical protein